MENRNVHFVVDLEINEGEVDQFAAVAQEMTEWTQAERGTIVYDWFMNGDRKRCRLLETYADAEAARAHVEGRVVQSLVPKLLGHSRLSGFEVYGDPGAEAGQMLSKVGAAFFERWKRIAR